MPCEEGAGRLRTGEGRALRPRSLGQLPEDRAGSPWEGALNIPGREQTCKAQRQDQHGRKEGGPAEQSWEVPGVLGSTGQSSQGR